MNIVKAFISAVFICMIIYGLLMTLAPEGTMSESFKSVIGISLVASFILAAVSALRSDIKIPDSFEIVLSQNESYNYSFAAEDETVKNTVSRYITDKLESAGISDVYVTVKTDISEDGGISITEAVIECDGNLIASAKEAVGDLGFSIYYKGINQNEVY